MNTGSMKGNTPKKHGFQARKFKKGVVLRDLVLAAYLCTFNVRKYVQDGSHNREKLQTTLISNIVRNLEFLYEVNIKI